MKRKRPKPGKTYRDPFYAWDPEALEAFYRAIESPGEAIRVEYEKCPVYGDCDIRSFTWDPYREEMTMYYRPVTASRGGYWYYDADGKSTRPPK